MAKDDYRVVDDKGEAHETCHGVPAFEWFKVISQVARELSIDLVDGVKRLGAKERSEGLLCSDPDCQRLNRLPRAGPSKPAVYKITTPLPVVTPSSLENEAEAKLCLGHPSNPPAYLCEYCARVATAKRYINERALGKHVYEHGGTKRMPQ